MNSSLTVAVELYQIQPGLSGGLVYWLQRLLADATRLDTSVRWILLCRERCLAFWSQAHSQVERLILSDQNYFAELDEVCRRQHVDVLLRSFPLHREMEFPAGRQMVLLPDLQHESRPEFFQEAELRERRLNFWQTRSLGAVVVPSLYTQACVRQHPIGWERKVVVCSPRLTPEKQKRAEPTTNYFLYPANLWPHKNHQRLLRAFALFRQRTGSHCELLLTGHALDGWPQLAQAFPDLPVRHLGCVSHAQLGG